MSRFQYDQVERITALLNASYLLVGRGQPLIHCLPVQVGINGNQHKNYRRQRNDFLFRHVLCLLQNSSPQSVN